MNEMVTAQRQDSLHDTTTVNDETLVADARAGLTPSQFVDSKLVHLLKSTLPVSHLPSTRVVRR